MTLGFEATFSFEVVLCAALVAAVTTAVVLKQRLTRREAQALEAERRAAASERLAELGAMTGGLAHEIKNPLSTVVLNAQLLREGCLLGRDSVHARIGSCSAGQLPKLVFGRPITLHERLATRSSQRVRLGRHLAPGG